jgi:hypothetical protein
LLFLMLFVELIPFSFSCIFPFSRHFLFCQNHFFHFGMLDNFIRPPNVGLY